MIGNILAADYFPDDRAGSGVVRLDRIVDGHRTNVLSFRVSGKREARELAKNYGAKPWNF